MSSITDLLAAERRLAARRNGSDEGLDRQARFVDERTESRDRGPVTHQHGCACSNDCLRVEAGL